MSFLGGIFTGSAPGLTGAGNTATGAAGFGTSVGEGDISTASGFDNTLLGGDQAQIAKLLAPQISNIQKEGQQQIQTAAEFGDRSGGTNASAQQNMDSQRAKVNDMVSQLTTGAASNLGNLGTSTLGLGLTANDQAAQDAEMELQNQQNSLLGNTIGSAVGTLGTGISGLGKGLIGW